MAPKVSVNIACYNHEDYVGKAIQSVLDQTFQDFEIIVCNNGSTDNSLKVIESFNDSRIKVETVIPNQQSTYAGNNCIKRGCGEYIALLCSDDAWEPDKLEKQVAYLDSHPKTGLIFTRVQPIMPNDEIITDKKNFYNKHFNNAKNTTRLEWLYSMWLTSDHSFCCSSACLKRECVDKLGMFDIRSKYIQDFILWADICTQYEVSIIDEKLTKMRYFPDKDNLSYLSNDVIIASLNEMQLLFEKFKKVDKLDDFIKFIPQVKKRFKILEEKYIPFYLSMLTLENSWQVNFKPAALSYLYEFMSNPKNREDLERDFNFTHMNLYKISTNYDTYRQKRLCRAIKFYAIMRIITVLKIGIIGEM